MSKRRIIRQAGWLVILLFFVLLFVPIHTRALTYREECVMDLLHVPFALLFSAMVFQLVCGPRGGRFPTWPVAALLFGAFLLSEWVQPLFGRSFSSVDLYYDVVGILGGWVLYAAFNRRELRIMWGLLPVVVLAVVPYTVQMTRYERLVNRFPLISDFSINLENPHWTLTGGEFRKTDSGNWEFVTHQSDAALFMDHPVKDWSPRAFVHIDFFVSEEASYTLRMDDQQNPETYFDRFQYEAQAAKGENRICIDLQESRISSGERLLDPTSISSIGFILHQVTSGLTFRVNRLVISTEECY